MKKQKGMAEYLILAWIVLLIAGGIGWIMNIVDIAQADWSHITGMLILRVIGIFIPPLGAVLGYL